MGTTVRYTKPQDGKRVSTEPTLTMVPGSEITDCKHGCCTPEIPGKYTIESNRELLQITQGELPDLFDRDTSGTVSNENTSDFDIHSVDGDAPEFNPGKRLEYARKHSDKLDRMVEWAKTGGEPPSIAHPNDRSRSESYLAWHLAYWMERNTIAVRHIMNRLNPPKWQERTDDFYREGILKAVERQPDTFDSIDTGPSGPSEELTLSVWLDLYTQGPMSTEEMAESVEYGERQTRKALNWLDDNGFINYERNGRSSQWVVNEESQDPLEEIETELNSIETMERYLK